MNCKHCCLAILLLAFVSTSFGQDSARKLKAEGLEYYNHNKYQEAANLLLKYQRIKPNDLEVRFKLGVCYYETNFIENAEKYLTYAVENSKKVDPLAFYYLGRCRHAENDFKKAIQFYKLFLKKAKSNAPQRSHVKDVILRCANGIRISNQEEVALVENLSDKVNSEGDDFAPLLSPNFDNKLYFSSSRRGNIGGLRNEDGLRDDQFGKYNADIYSSVIINGEWAATTPMSSLINGPKNELVLEFNSDGSIMYFFKGKSLYSGEIFVDTFRTTEESRPLFPPQFISPMFAEDGDGYPFFVADSIMLFCSRRKGGFGGSDIYMTSYSNGVWSVPKNLGPEINSAYDEVSPFLSKDGRTLYFSSNNSRASLGGLDVFKSRFDDASLQWSAPQNLGLPINSSEDDLHFRLTKDGLKAYFSTSRKDGIGMRDIYVAYFKSPRNEQIYSSIPEHFVEVLAYSQPSNPYAPTTSISPETEAVQAPVTTFDPNQEVESYEFQPVYYDNDDDVLNSRNIKKMNKVALLLKKYPQLKVVLACNSAEFDGPLQFDLYFAVKRAEIAANYLIENGVAAENIRVKGLGSIYPLAKAMTEQGDNPLAKRYNNRIDFYIGKCLRITG